MNKPEQKFAAAFCVFLDLVSVFKEARKNLIFFSLSLTRQAENFKTICACAESTDLFYRP
jgi:hypothetical protein